MDTASVLLNTDGAVQDNARAVVGFLTLLRHRVGSTEWVLQALFLRCEDAEFLLASATARRVSAAVLCIHCAPDPVQQASPTAMGGVVSPEFGASVGFASLQGIPQNVRCQRTLK